MMLSLLPEDLELEFESLAGSQADALSAALEGPSPYNGSLPFAVELRVHLDVVDDDFVATIKKPGDGAVVQVSNAIGFPRELALCLAAHQLLGLEKHETLAELTSDLANYGYRFISMPTGAARGLTETVLLLADPISELDAALQLGAEPAYIYDLLDGGADPMRLHVRFGRPYQVARLKSLGPRPDYAEVVEYMRAFGAH